MKLFKKKRKTELNYNERVWIENLLLRKIAEEKLTEMPDYVSKYELEMCNNIINKLKP